jgi:hypothetical protein
MDAAADHDFESCLASRVNLIDVLLGRRLLRSPHDSVSEETHMASNYSAYLTREP